MNVSGASPNTEMTRIEIARSEIAHIRNGRGALLRVQYGAVWLTQYGSPDDVVLGAGASFRIHRDGLTLVSACGPAPYALVTLAPAMRVTPSLAKRFWSLLVGLRMPSRQPIRGI
ncbi:DUF2917 domain-containing protein [Aromatoleum diolicum]|uniref:DUF2917 domain-containing protein n=1 Tax=Aromatoleum diolicum TaxID=75796 RepID=A0ABX1QCU9_9RHOO|nr:DUF2917 domain-containing protein [Aromatoleum diolicum]NMG76222.1 DUF2917 domain-containing protein [Aromatoleum diolicum]